MPRQAPRIDQPILEAIAALDDPTLPIAETCRRVGVFAERVGVVRPSYEQVRVLVHDAGVETRRDDGVSSAPWTCT